LMTKRNTLDHKILKNDYDLGKAKGRAFLKTLI